MISLLTAAEACGPAGDGDEHRPTGRLLIEGQNLWMVAHRRRAAARRERREQEDAAQRMANFGKTLVMLLDDLHILNKCSVCFL